MTLLNIFHSGALIWVISAVFLGLIGWFAYQAYKAHNSGWVKDDPNNFQHTEGTEKIPYWSIPQTWFAVVVLVIYIVVLFMIGSDYKGV